MRWRERLRGEILETLWSTVRHEYLSASDIIPSCDVFRITSDQTAIDCDEYSLSEKALSLSALSSRIETSLGGHVTVVDVILHPKYHTIELPDSDTIDLFEVDLAIGLPQLHKVSFSPRREDRGLSDPKHTGAQRTTRLNPTPKAERIPDSDSQEPLEERLRWILTPPIHELLSDPNLGLPHTPYSYEAMGLTEEQFFSLFKNLKARPKRARASGAPPRLVLDNMDDKEFERLVAEIYKAPGYDVRVTGGSHDGGIDIVAEQTNNPGRDRIVIQCKHMKANVGRPDLQKLWGVVSDDQQITSGHFVTSSGFTSEAKQFAMGKRLETIDRKDLKELVRTFNVAELVDE